MELALASSNDIEQLSPRGIRGLLSDLSGAIDEVPCPVNNETECN